MSKAPFNLDEYKNDLDVDDVFGEEGYSTNERTSIRPSLDVNGIWGGYIGEGAKPFFRQRHMQKYRCV